MLPPSRPSKNSQQPRQIIDPDDAIRSTDDDAAASRLSAASLGYLDDPFVSVLYKPRYTPTQTPGAGPSNLRKPPLINVGTHHRTYALDLIVDKFLDNGGKQIVSLGAGSDTRFWRIMSKRRSNLLERYIEIDFPHVTSTKAQRISRSQRLSLLLSSQSSPDSNLPSSERITPTSSKNYTISQGGTALSSNQFTLLPLDLRKNPSETLEINLLPLLNPELPTLFLAECLFCYMSPEIGKDIVSLFGRRFESCVGVIYEMVGLDDTFGQVMKRNLATRHLSLPGAIFPTPQAQADRFKDPTLGRGIFTSAGAKNLWQIREEVIDPLELQRISKLEFLDEIEELRLVLSHYCIAWGIKGDSMENVGL